ncbi:MAG: hypothetical protein OFPI_43320 [Osedax symbiont Rs2]|nr:MAG: hypothetical protein OFPI_43320 [Osedax symbiont Rs2]
MGPLNCFHSLISIVDQETAVLVSSNALNRYVSHQPLLTDQAVELINLLQQQLVS